MVSELWFQTGEKKELYLDRSLPDMIRPICLLLRTLHCTKDLRIS